MRPILPLILAPLLLAAACSDQRDVMDELPNSSLAGAPRESVSESVMDAPIARPVTIGEDGPRMDACGALGMVTRPPADGLPLRAAPFADAKSLAQLGEGARVHICTRSLDQKWLGVVVAPAPAPPPDPDVPDGTPAAPPAPLDCGVSASVDSRRPYAGPCASGWVASASIRLIGT